MILLVLAKYLFKELSFIDKGLNWAYTNVSFHLYENFSFFPEQWQLPLSKVFFLPQYISIHWWHSISHSQLYNNIQANDIGFQYPKENLILSQVFLPFQFIWQDFCFNYSEIRLNSEETKKKQNTSLLFYNYKSFQKRYIMSRLPAYFILIELCHHLKFRYVSKS